MSAFQPTLPPSSSALTTPIPLRHHCIKQTSLQILRISKRPRPALLCTCSLPPTLSNLAASLKSHPTSQSRYLALIQLANQLPTLPVESQLPSTRIPGCTAISHLQATLLPSNLVSLSASADAQVSRGLLALVVLGLNHLPIPTILAVSPSQLLQASGLSGTLTPSRATGIASILAHLHSQVSALSPSTVSPHSTPSKVPYTSVQTEDVAVLLSGGVDSSVAMRLAIDSGYRPHAFYLKIWLEDELAHLGQCPWEDDLHYARAVCQQAGVSLTDLGLQKEYWEKVVQYTVDEARAGRTPNPDVMCNSRIKFGAFLERVGSEFSKVFSGHYARKVWAEDGRAEVWCSADVVKDQTYFLGGLGQEQVRIAEFPLGGLQKREVRELARGYKLPNKERKESQGICFLGKLKFDDFLRYHLGERKGRLVEFESGKTLGWHGGFWFYTIGQRRGIRLSGGPWHVVCKDVEENVVYVSKNYNGMDMRRHSFDFEAASWIGGMWPEGWGIGNGKKLKVKTRHTSHFHTAVVVRTGRDSGSVELGERDKGLAAGQFVVFYEEQGRCLGSGVIVNNRHLANRPSQILEVDSRSIRLQ